MNTITLWHGGRHLESQYKEMFSSKKGRWEHGPGLYLTTHYDTAYQYSRGGGKTYLVEVELGNNIHDITLPIETVNNFISQYVVQSKRKALLDDIYSNMHRMKSDPFIRAEHFLNLVFNLEAITSSKTKDLAQFLVENGVDYGVVNRFKGRDESLIVVYNRAKINSVKSIAAKDVTLDQWELPFIALENKKMQFK